ncbi:uncharacterized protein LOC129906274 [Episyrphus balteatus]|uniref:uncharacterized protein LOC129906274 n=1 Tax=Episyrphus balteatus TaxID=286459 RepID=UPI0024860FFA|nr:uncharacterized protein LOC129906274 [Episyrphus balteatus]
MACLNMKRAETSNDNSNLRLESRMLEIGEPKYISRKGCQVVNCTIRCLSSKKIYDEVFQVLQSTECEENIILQLDHQHFPNFVLSNRWKSASKMIKSLVIRNSEFSHIRNEAFNSIDFTGTQTLTLLGVKLDTLGNGVLLGFARLQSIHMEGKVRNVDRCFFQPVQSFLMRLTLKADLTISGKDNIFGISFMSNLHALDLSENTITGSLARTFFIGVPHLRYLILSDSEISSIEIDAFDDIAASLTMLDLSNNRLKTLDIRCMEQLVTIGSARIYLLGNEWLCECHLRPLVTLYEDYPNSFGDIPYCKGPRALYGAYLTNLKFDKNCKILNDTDKGLMATPIEYYKTDSIIASSSSTEATIVVDPAYSFKMACLSIIGLADTTEPSTEGDPVEYFLFAPPCHDFELILLQNNSVQVVVEYADEPINIIWFSEALENFVHTVNDITIDYNCEMYSDPFLLAENLVENCTYTFCLIPSGYFSITPFNCLPLHVPSKIKTVPDIWISHDEKDLTLGIVSLILMCSLLLGGVIAYFGIKAYPDILEGTNHVLVVKKSKKAACYVSTITESEYIIQKDSLKKKNSSNRDSSIPLPVSLYNDIEGPRQESVREDYYEMPCIYNQTHDCQQKCLGNNKCVISPSSPPPLPKRNNSDSTLYGSASELICDVPYPKLSL